MTSEPASFDSDVHFYLANSYAPETIDDFDDYYELNFDGEDEQDFDCGYVPTLGTCLLGGSEDCDFECPYRDAIEAGTWDEQQGEEDSEGKRDCWN